MRNVENIMKAAGEACNDWSNYPAGPEHVVVSAALLIPSGLEEILLQALEAAKTDFTDLLVLSPKEYLMACYAICYREAQKNGRRARVACFGLEDAPAMSADLTEQVVRRKVTLVAPIESVQGCEFKTVIVIRNRGFVLGDAKNYNKNMFNISSHKNMYLRAVVRLVVIEH